ncbi:MAG: hypothetical protein H0U45_17440 [Tatlockia sp.]|nr:hypothetical protein [Tatlockia sp.]
MISTFKSTSLEKNFPVTYPPLPEHLEKLIDSPWNPDHSRQIDWWLWYDEQEPWQTAGGKS